MSVLRNKFLNCRQLASVVYRGLSSTTQRAAVSSDAIGVKQSIDCWNCHHQHTNELFCPVCSSIQCTQCSTKKLNYFQVMKNEVTFDIQLATIKQYYLKLQNMLHPDRFASRSELERDYSNTQSALVNRAYKTLSDPLKRGLYILGLHGYELDAEQTESSDSELLNEIFMINFELDECEDKEKLLEMQTRIIESIDNDLTEVSETFKQEEYENARDALIRLKYRTSIKIKIEDKLFTMD